MPRDRIYITGPYYSDDVPGTIGPLLALAEHWPVEALVPYVFWVQWVKAHGYSIDAYPYDTQWLPMTRPLFKECAGMVTLPCDSWRIQFEQQVASACGIPCVEIHNGQ